MNELRNSGLSTVVVLLIVLSFPLLSHGQETALDHCVDGVEAFDFGDYDNALMSLQKAVQLEPDNVEYLYYLGLTHSAMGQDKEAIQVFESVVAKEPVEGANAYFEMASIHSEKRRYQKALDVLDRAEKALPDNPRVYLEKGVVYRDMKDYENAVVNMNRARALDPDLAQVVDYNVGGVHFEKEEFDQAEEMFEKAITVDPESVVAENARQSIANLDKARRSRKPWYIWSTIAWGYDTNVSLDARDGVQVRLPDQPSNKKDQFQIFQVNGGYKIVNRKDLEVGLGYQFRTTGYKKWVAYNLTGHRPYAFFRYQRNPVIFRFMYEPSWWYEGGNDGSAQDHGFYLTFGSSSDKFLQSHSFRPSVTFLEPYDMQTSITADYQIRDYSRGLVYGLDSDSKVYGASIIQSFKIPGVECYPSAGFKYFQENADDSEDSYRFGAIHASVSGKLFWEIWGNVTGSYGKIKFNNNSDFKLDGKRDDDQWQIGGSLRRAITDFLYLSAYYSYTDNDSNVSYGGNDPFSFDKSVYAGLLTFLY